jgi:hypothetical protein
MAERTDEQYPFLEHRRLLFATACRMLGTVTITDAWTFPRTLG